VQGAAAARNTLLEEGAACDLIIFFDDDVLPAPDCVAAYVAALRAHPDAAGFAGAAGTALWRSGPQLIWWVESGKG
jgi:GT2 family glycosyltransferase